MIKLIHTADWHLGQTFFGYDRIREHEIFLRDLRRVVCEREVDLLLISGDIFDTSNPSAEAMRLYYGFLRDITADNRDMQVIAIAGNHDSGARLEAPHPVLESINVITRGTIRRKEDGTPDYGRHAVPVTRDGRTVAYCLAVPYLRAGDYPEADTYSESIALFYKGVYDHVRTLDPEGTIPVIAMGHMQTAGAALSEDDRNERSITGGLECVGSDMFDARTAYTALGHAGEAAFAPRGRSRCGIAVRGDEGVGVGSGARVTPSYRGGFGRSERTSHAHRGCSHGMRRCRSRSVARSARDKPYGDGSRDIQASLRRRHVRGYAKSARSGHRRGTTTITA